MLALLSAMFFLDGVGKGILASGIYCYQIALIYSSACSVFQNSDFGSNPAVPLEFGAPIFYLQLSLEIVQGQILFVFPHYLNLV